MLWTLQLSSRLLLVAQAAVENFVAANDDQPGLKSLTVINFLLKVKSKAAVRMISASSPSVFFWLMAAKVSCHHVMLYCSNCAV